MFGQEIIKNDNQKNTYTITEPNIWSMLYLGVSFDTIYKLIVNDGKYVVVDVKGNKALLIKRKNNFIVSEETFFKSGELKQRIIYGKEGVQEGYKVWNEYGEIIEKGDFKVKKKRKEINNIEWVFDNYTIGYYYLNQIDGELASDSNTIILNYIGYFIDGGEFDNSFSRNEKLSIDLSNSPYLKSFTHAVRQFREGQKGFFKLTPDLAYGNTPVGNIPANSTLIYFVEIVAFQ